MPVEWSIITELMMSRVGLSALDGVEHRPVLRVQVEQDADVAELEVGVDQARRAGPSRGGARAPGWWRCVVRPAPPFGREDGDDLVLARRSRRAGAERDRVAPARPASCSRRTSSRSWTRLMRGRELVAAERLDQELTRAGRASARLSCSASPWTLIMMIGAGRQPLRDDLGSGDAVHVRAC